MISTPSSYSLPTLASRVGSVPLGDGPILLMENLAAGEVEPPILLDQPTTHIAISRPGDRATAQFIIHRSAEGWNLEAREIDCRRNGEHVTESPLADGDRIVVANTEFQVRTATAAELLGHLPQIGQPEQRVSDRALAIEARERDLAEWEQCLAECEADLRLREMAVEHWQTGEPETRIDEPIGAGSTEDVSLRDDDADADFILELERLRTDRATFENDRQRLHQWLIALQKERAELKAEQERLSADRRRLNTDDGPQMPVTAARIAMPVDNLAPRCSEPAAAHTGTDCRSRSVSVDEDLANAADPPSHSAIEADERAPSREEVRETRQRLNTLRGIVNDSARQALKRQFWRHQRSALVLKIALAGMSFALAGVLYTNHGVTNSPIGAIAWGAAAIGLITLSGLFHTWSEVNRLNQRFRAPAADEPHSVVGVGS
jgi:hypothetical protein